jgi:hypothetical protein
MMHPGWFTLDIARDDTVNHPPEKKAPEEKPPPLPPAGE